MSFVRSVKSSGWVYAAGMFCLFSAAIATAADLYRYRNDEGNLVINHTVPPQFAKNGYERLDSSGRVVERVEVPPPKLDTDEPEENETESVSPKVAVSQERRDKYLLTSFSTVEEISAAQERKLGQLFREIEITTGNVETVEQQRLATEQEAAQFQRGGKDIPEELQKRLTDVVERGQKARESMESRKIEHTQAKKLYDGYIERFKELKGLPLAPLDSEAPETGSETESAIDPPNALLAND